MTESDSPAQFFEEFLPKHFARIAAAPPVPPPSFSTAPIVIRVVGAGVWTLALVDAQLAVTQGDSDSCALQVSLDPSGFSALVLGPARRAALAVPDGVGPSRGVWTRLARWDSETTDLIRNVPGAVLVRVQDENRSLAVAITPGNLPYSLAEAPCTVDCRLQDLHALEQGTANPLGLLSEGHIRLAGDAQIAMGLASLFL